MNLRYFSISEFACRCGNCENRIDLGFVRELDELRHRYGRPLMVSSGYRCPTYNAKVSSTGRTGPHTTGKAGDLLVDRGDAFQLLRLAMGMDFTGIGIQQKGGGRFIHLDTLPNASGQPRPTLWSY
jgi:zinc D-Ala-D-Ala carboxypeptidase